MYTHTPYSRAFLEDALAAMAPRPRELRTASPSSLGMNTLRGGAPVPPAIAPTPAPVFECPPAKSGQGKVTVLNRAGPLFFRVYRVNESLFCQEGQKCVQSVTAPHSPLYQVGANRRACLYYNRLGLAAPGTTLRLYWSKIAADLTFAGPDPQLRNLDRNNARILSGREVVAVGPRDVAAGGGKLITF